MREREIERESPSYVSFYLIVRCTDSLDLLPIGETNIVSKLARKKMEESEKSLAWNKKMKNEKE